MSNPKTENTDRPETGKRPWTKPELQIVRISQTAAGGNPLKTEGGFAKGS